MPSLRLIHSATARESRPPHPTPPRYHTVPGTRSARPDGSDVRTSPAPPLHRAESDRQSDSAPCTRAAPAPPGPSIPPQDPQYAHDPRYPQDPQYPRYPQRTPRPPPSRPTHGSRRQRLPCPILPPRSTARLTPPTPPPPHGRGVRPGNEGLRPSCRPSVHPAPQLSAGRD